MKNISYVLILFLLCCNYKSDDKARNLTNDFIKSNYSNNWNEIKYLLVIPSSGCGGCISSAEEIMLLSLRNQRKDIKFILTGFTSKKSLNLTYEKNILENKAIFVDGKNYFFNTLTNSNYPQLITLKNGFFYKIQEISPENKEPVLEKIKIEMLKQ